MFTTPACIFAASLVGMCVFEPRTVFPNAPASHDTHCVNPLLGPYVPKPHEVHAVEEALAEYDPALQSVHVDAPDDTPVDAPALQAVQLREALALE